MRILLTRAANDAAQTREKLLVLGHDVVESPVIEIAPTHAIWPSGVVDAILATSGHAFVVPLEGPTLEVRRLVPLFLVGRRTEAFARDAGFLGPATVAKDAATLSIEIGKLLTGPKRIVYAAGRDRKPAVENAPSVVGHKLQVIEVYEARAVDSPTLEATRALRHGSIDAILHFSQRSATLFLAVASAHGLDIRRPIHFCLSEDVAAPLREAGLEDIHVAETPNEQALFALLPVAEGA